MSITGIETLVYGVEDLEQSSRFFTDFGLNPVHADAAHSIFGLAEGSSVILRRRDDPLLPDHVMTGDGVREVIWGVASADALERLVERVGEVCPVTRDSDGTAHFMTPFGIAMGLRVYARKRVVYAPDPVNAPDNIRRLNTHRKWRERARPKVIAHVVFAVPDYMDGYAFMRDRLGFRLSDHQRGFGMYLRCDGSNSHHNMLFLNANAPLPDMDGKVRFHHANFGVEDVDELMIGANHMARKGWEASHLGFGRHRVDSALFYYIPCPAGGEAEYGADSDYVDDNWVPREWINPLFAYSHFVHNLPPFLQDSPSWEIKYLTEEAAAHSGGAH